MTPAERVWAAALAAAAEACEADMRVHVFTSIDVTATQDDLRRMLAARIRALPMPATLGEGAADPACDCAHLKSQHRKNGRCLVCDCQCFRDVAELAAQLAEMEATDPAVARAAAKYDETVKAIVSQPVAAPAVCDACGQRRDRHYVDCPTCVAYACRCGSGKAATK